MSDQQSGKWSRRAFLLLGAGGVSALAGVAGWSRWRSIGTLGHVQAQPSSLPLDAAITTSISHLLGTVFGIPLSEADHADLQGRLVYATEHDGAWGDEYRWLVEFVDDIASDSGAASFVSASADSREKIVRIALADDVEWRTQKIQAFVRADGRKLLRMRKSTIPHLLRLYQYSSVPWRHRGYTSWPGMADDRLAYTRKLETSRC
jgi:hypothetical protein